jgi:hypothetical protein
MDSMSPALRSPIPFYFIFIPGRQEVLTAGNPRLPLPNSVASSKLFNNSEILFL